MDITITDVAKRADVSVATVSRVLNNQSGYSEATRKKVMEVIKEMGYQPNSLAQGLAGKRTKTVGVLIPKVSSMVTSKILNGIEDAAHKEEHSVIICNTDNDGIRTENYIQVLRKKRIEGLIIVSQNLTKIQVDKIIEMNIPVVLVSTANENFNYVKVDDYQASYDACTYLIKKGHRKIAMLSGTKSDKISGKSRVEGYRNALKDYGLPVNEENILYGDFGFKAGRENMKKLLANDHEFTAIFAASDEMAVGALRIAYENDIRVPDDISIMSYDGTQLTEMSTPPLTVLNQPFYKMGFAGLNMLIAKIEGKEVKNRIIKHRIIERASVKNLNSDRL